VQNQIRELYRSIDTNHNGSLNRDEIGRVLQTLRPGPITAAEVANVFHAMDTNGDGNIDISEFETAVLGWMNN
jgi:Ca2+-binding EF-hand superfamily protein